MAQQLSLFGEELDIVAPSSDDSVLKKLKKPLKEMSIEKIIESKIIDIPSRMAHIEKEVHRILGHYTEDTLTIKSYDEYVSYIDKAIENGIIALDTETNNTTDYMVAQLMGLCLYTPSLKACYIPVNHVDMLGNRLGWQLNESQIASQLLRLIGHGVKILFHNAKFDYQIIYKTCGVKLSIYWDSYVAARLLDENEPSSGLKQQYISKIDPNQEKYNIEELFEGLPYAIFAPELFALYSATDALMTYKLYLWQLDKFQDPSLKGVWNIYQTEELPLISVVAEAEMRGVDLDNEYALRLKDKYTVLLEDRRTKVNNTLKELEPTIAKWRLTPEANARSLNKAGTGLGKSKSEQLSNPVEVSSPTQLAILLYDILKFPPMDKSKPRHTGKETLDKLYKKYNQPFLKSLKEFKDLEKVVKDFIVAIPKFASEVDGRVHCSFFPLGTDTGRFSCKEPNLQQLPRANIEVKPMFRATPSKTKEVEFGDSLILNRLDELEIDGNWVKAKDLKVGDTIDGCQIVGLSFSEDMIQIQLN